MSLIVTLKENRDFQRIYRKGNSYVSSGLVIYVLKNKRNNLRFGITTGKKIGNAVMRSRSRRIIRVAFSKLSPNLKKGYDFVFVARSKTPFLKSTDIYREMKRLMEKANLLENNSEKVYN